MDDDAVGAEQLLVRRNHGGNARRAFFLLTIEQHLYVERRFQAGLPETVESGKEHHDRSLVIRGTTREHAQIRLKLVLEKPLRPDDRPLAVGAALLYHRLPGAGLRPLAI